MMDTTPEPPPPILRLHVDSAALAANWRTLDRLSGTANTGAAVKAGGYGLGIDRVMTTLTQAGARMFFVAHWSEVPALLAHVPGPQVAVLHGPLTPAEAAFARATHTRPVINSLHQAQVWLDSGGGLCDLMVDTGINRLGLPPAELGDPLVARLEIDTLHSHLASADEDSALNGRQLALFREIATLGLAPRHALANSAGIALGPQYAFDLTRPGLALYGGVPRRELADSIRQVVYLEAAVLQVRDLLAGDSVGYNATFTAPAPMRIATVAIGYADGFLRAWSGRAAFRFEDADLPQIGRVSMDMAVLDAGAAPHLRAGDMVEVPYALPHAARVSGLSQYELLTTLGRRFDHIASRARHSCDAAYANV